MSDVIVCPKCECEIEVTEVLSNQLRSKIQKEYEAENRQQEAAMAKREQEILQAREQLAQAQSEIDQRVSEQIAKERKQLSEEALAKAREQVTVEIRDKEQQLADAQSKLKLAQESELVLRKERRELEEQKNALELTVARKLDEERNKIRDAAKREAAEEQSMQIATEKKVNDDLRKRIADLERLAAQGSQQLQGEVLEIALEELLRKQFPFDEIIPVPKGIHGGDVTQVVRDASGTVCGTILWESKRTKTWSEGWLAKLRDDQRAAKAQLAILVSIELPKEVTTFRYIDGVWVSSVSCAISVAHALRAGLIEVAAAKRSLEGRHDKMEMLYKYLSGQEFRHRVEGIVEAFVTLREDLEAEKRATQRLWSKREKQLERATMQTAGLYGDLSGIIGGSLPVIEKLEVPALESPTTNVQPSSDTTESEIEAPL